MAAWVNRSTGLQVPANRWWLAGGMSNEDCVVAYQAIGASSLADSYINLRDPGTNNASPVVAPTFAAASGWTFAGAEHLTTGITGDGLQSMVVRCRMQLVPGTRNSICGYDTGGRQFYLENDTLGANKRAYYGYNATEASATVGASLDDVLAIARNRYFYNGIFGGTVGSLASWNEGTITIGNDITATAAKFSGSIQAFALYNRQLTDAEVGEITSQVDALTTSSSPDEVTDPINWIVQNPSTKFLPSISHELWAAGDRNIYRTLNGGRSWATMALPDPSNAEFGDSPAATVDELSWHWIDYDPTDPLVLLALAAKASASRVWLYRTENLGDTWTSRGVIA